MNRKSLLGGALALALAGATVVAGPSQAVVAGTGTSSVSAQLLGVDLGSGGEVLGLDLVGEEGSATNAGSPSARALLSTFATSSGLVDALDGIGPMYEASSGDPADEAIAPIELSLPAGVLSARIVPQVPTATADESGSRASAGAVVEDLSLVGGLITADRLATTLGAHTLSSGANGSRSLVVENLKVLDLGALLAGLGIDPLDLPIGTLSSLLDDLAVEVPGVDPAATVEQTLSELTGELETLIGLLPVGTLSAQTVDPAPVESAQLLPIPIDIPGVELPGTDGELDPDIIGGVLDGVDGIIDGVDEQLPLDLPPLTDELQGLLDELGLDVGATVGELVTAIEEKQDELTGVLTSTLDTIEDAPLLRVGRIEIGMVSSATESLESSVANVTAKVEGLEVGELGSLGGITLPAGPLSVDVQDQLSSLLGAVEGAIGDVLGGVAPALAGIVDIKLFEEFESVTKDGDTVKSIAGLAALTVTVTPPADLAAIVGTITDGTGLGDVLDLAGIALPVVEQAMAELTAALRGVVAGGVSAQQVDLGALAQGVTLRLGTFTSNATFTPTPASVAPPAAPGTPSVDVPVATGAPAAPASPAAPAGPAAPVELPRTGSSATYVLLAGALLLIALGLGLPQWAEATVRSTSRSGKRNT